MTILESWKLDLGMLRPQSLKRLALSAFNLLKNNALQIAIFFVGGFSVFVGIQILLQNVFGGVNTLSRYWEYFCYFGFVVGAVAIFRSSVEKKVSNIIGSSLFLQLFQFYLPLFSIMY